MTGGCTMPTALIVASRSASACGAEDLVRRIWIRILLQRARIDRYQFHGMFSISGGCGPRFPGGPSRLLLEDSLPARRAGGAAQLPPSIPARQARAGRVSALRAPPRPGSRDGRLSVSGAAPTVLRAGFPAHAALRFSSPFNCTASSPLAARFASTSASCARLRSSSAAKAKASPTRPR